MSLNAKFRTEKTLEQEGITIEYEDDGEVLAWFKCRRPGGRNSLFTKTFSDKLRESRQALAADEDGTVENKLLAEVYADSVIIDWGGQIEGPDGEIPPECNPKNIVWLFTEEAPDLFRDLQNRLSIRRNWQNREDEAKNSKPASTTNSSGGRKKKSS